MARAGLVAALGDWSAGDGPLQRKLADALRGAVVRGDLAPGTRLPSERVLARSLAISRSTVVAALDALRLEGVVATRRGSGTVVVADARRRAPAPDRSEAIRRNVIAQAFVEGSGGAVELLGAHVDATPVVDPAVFTAAAEDLRSWMSGPGYVPLGIPPLREAIARYLGKRGLPTDPEQVIVTNGAQQALALATSLFVRPGDTVLVESPTYLTAIDGFRTAGANLEGVAVGPEGVDLAAFREALRRTRAPLAYLVPTFHNPTGTTIPERVRAELATLAAERGTVLVEDETLADLGFDDAPVPRPIARWASSAPVLTLGSMSKVFWGGLRVGWVRAPAEVVRRLARLKTVGDLGSSLPSQVVAVRLLAELERHREVRRALIVRSMEALADQLRTHLPTWTWDRPGGGLCLWVRIPQGDAAELAQVARRHGVSIVPGHLAGPQGGFHDRVRLPLSTPPDVLAAGIARLAEAWHAYLPTIERRRTSFDVLV